MATLKASKLRASLERAKKVGIIEESIRLGDVDLVLRNLQPEEMEQIVAEADDKEGVEYLHCFQMGHVCRGLVEIDGQDLREVDFVEIEIDQGEGEPEIRIVERYEFVRDELLKTWGREAIAVGFRKVSELFLKADFKMKSGVKFDYAEETPEDRYRRLLDEAKEAEGQIQDDELKNSILSEHGYLPATTPEEREAIKRRADEFAQERVEQARAREAEAVPEPQGAPVASPPALPPQVPSPASDAPQAVPQPPQDLMANRRPLNRDAIDPPVPQQPVTRAVRPQRPPASRSLPPNVPAQPPQVLSQEGQPGPGFVATRRAQIQAEMLAMEELDPEMAAELEQARTQAASRSRDQIPELARRAPQMDPTETVQILDRKPQGGINPRYNPPR